MSSKLLIWLAVVLLIPALRLPVAAQPAFPASTPGATHSLPAIAASPAASPVAVELDQTLAAYQGRVEELSRRGRTVVEALLANDQQTLGDALSPEAQRALGPSGATDVIASFETDRVHAEFPEVNAVFDGHLAGTDIEGVFVQGAPMPFQLSTGDVHDGGAPSGRWTGAITTPGGELEIALTFAGDVDRLTATLDIPAQNIAEQPLSNVRFTAEQPIGERQAERALPLGPRNATYSADYTWGEGTLRFTVATDPDGTVIGLTAVPVWPLPPDPLADYTSDVTYRLPFDGTWFVVWGGDTELLNYHAVTPNQRHALDILIWKDGATYRGDGTHNENYWVWGQPLTAPADGTVVAAVDGTPDNAPGQLASAETHPAGNHVVIETAPEEFVFLAHIQQGSVAVQPGDTVSAGAVVGLAGNSGNSSEPHLHIHLQTVPDFFDPAAQGVPLAFSNYAANGEPVAQGEPRQGQFIAPSAE